MVINFLSLSQEFSTQKMKAVDVFRNSDIYLEDYAVSNPRGPVLTPVLILPSSDAPFFIPFISALILDCKLRKCIH
jgi:hypothetical protein